MEANRRENRFFLMKFPRGVGLHEESEVISQQKITNSATLAKRRLKIYTETKSKAGSDGKATCIAAIRPLSCPRGPRAARKEPELSAEFPFTPLKAKNRSPVLTNKGI